MSYTLPSSAKPFTLAVSAQDYSEWRQLLQLSKLAPDTWEGQQQDRRFGPSRTWLSDAKDYWLNTFDWREQEAYINSFPNYTMQIEDVNVHFVALFSHNKDAVPIIFMHGWPGSFIEFLPMCELIRQKWAGKDLPYHIIIPSLPGYTLSTVQSTDKDWTMQDSARIMNQLMVALGFEKYLAQGGDIGSFVAQCLSQEYDACVGCHLNMMFVADQPDVNALSPLEKKAYDRATIWRTTSTAYAQEHGTRPNTIGAVLSSNPLALLAWIGEKFLEWTDAPPSLYHFDKHLPLLVYIFLPTLHLSLPANLWCLRATVIQVP